MVENEIVSGLRFLQVVKRAGVTVDKTEAMLGSYGPQPQPYIKVVSTRWQVPSSHQFASEESPSGMLARSGTYSVKTRIMDDDGNKWLDDFEWSECAEVWAVARAVARDVSLTNAAFKLAKEW